MGSTDKTTNQSTFITFEGGEGTGKSTQVQRLAERLKAAGRTVVTTREPGGAPSAEEIRTLLVTGEPDRWTALSEALLNFTARAEHLEHTIRPALARDAIVLCDRFVDSTMAYQAYAGGVPPETITTLTRLVVGETMPDLTLILDLPVEVGLSRAQGRGDHENRYEKKGEAYHHKLRDAFLEIAKAEPNRCAVIDASGTIDDIADAIWSIVCERLSLSENAQ